MIYVQNTKRRGPSASPHLCVKASKPEEHARGDMKK